MNNTHAPQPTASSGKALASLLLGLTSVGLCLNVFTGIPAVILGMIALGEIKRENRSGRGMAICGIVFGALGTLFMPIMLLVALLAPALLGARAAAQDTHAKSNLHQVHLGMAMVLHSGDGGFPAAASGTPPNQVSWRVTIAPYLDAVQVAEEYDTNQPWDSVANAPFVPMIPDVLVSPGDTTVPFGHTNTLVLVGEETFFSPDGSRTSTDQVRDGMSTTILLVEADDDRAVVWIQPQDLDFDPNDPLAGLGTKRLGHFNVIFADGRVQSISDDINPDVFRAMTTPDGGEIIPAVNF